MVSPSILKSTHDLSIFNRATAARVIVINFAGFTSCVWRRIFVQKLARNSDVSFLNGVVEDEDRMLDAVRRRKPIRSDGAGFHLVMAHLVREPFTPGTQKGSDDNEIGNIRSASDEAKASPRRATH